MPKFTFALFFFLFSFYACNQSAHQSIPVLKATSDRADYKIGNEWVRGNWRISPAIKADSLVIPCYAEHEKFVFYTDRDSISFDLGPGSVHQFYVSLNDTAMALTVVKGVTSNYNVLSFDTTSVNKELTFWYEQNTDNEYLNRLRALYPIDSLVKDAHSDTEKALKITNWVHNQWSHDGSNEPRKSDAISILEEVKEGKNFRCVEYGIVATACLNAVGLKARTLALKTSDVETRPSGAGHVLLEVFLNDLQKWVLLDGQWDVMPLLNGIPLNAVEFQKALSDHYPELEIRSSSNVSKRKYGAWIYPYLYYFDIAFDNRETNPKFTGLSMGQRKLMLVPLGAKHPTVFQGKGQIKECLYTSSYNDFYAPPQALNEK